LTVETDEASETEELLPDPVVEADTQTRVRPIVTTATAPSPAPLTAVDRCDRCGAQAYLRVQLKSGGELLFCAHHAREHSDKLREVAEHVQDETGRLSDKKSASSDA
jgi:hypothetical protein